METIICNLNMFDMNQYIYKHNDNTKDFIPIGEVPVEALAQKIATECKINEIHFVHLYGDEIFLEPIVENIKEFGKQNYAFEDINVEVN